MPKASPAVALLAMHGYSCTEIAAAIPKSASNTSRVITGDYGWTDEVEKALLEVTSDRKLTNRIKGMAEQSRLTKLKQRRETKQVAL